MIHGKEDVLKKETASRVDEMRLKYCWAAAHAFDEWVEEMTVDRQMLSLVPRKQLTK